MLTIQWRWFPDCRPCRSSPWPRWWGCCRTTLHKNGMPDMATAVGTGMQGGPQREAGRREKNPIAGAATAAEAKASDEALENLLALDTRCKLSWDTA